MLSARYGGSGASDADRIALLLRELQATPQAMRTARFRCVIAVAEPDGTVQLAEGCCEGQIAQAPRGSHGFGYDPIFEIPWLGRTFAEVEAAVKNRLSHRGLAMRNARGILEQVLRKHMSGRAGPESDRGGG